MPDCSTGGLAVSQTIKGRHLGRSDYSIRTMLRCYALDPGMPVINSTSFGVPPQPPCIRQQLYGSGP
jgi:hypothetical protein